MNRPIWYATMASRSACETGTAAAAWPSVALFACTVRSKWMAAAEPFWCVSRPSHMTVLRNARFVVGSGRRKRDSSLPLAFRPA